MGTITERQRRDGTTAYLAQVVVKERGAIVRRENRTFDCPRLAKAWMAERETDRSPSKSDPTLGEVIDRYIRESRTIRRTKAQALDTMKRQPIARQRCSKITTADFVALARTLSQGRRKPQTVGNYLSHLRSVFSIARAAWGVPLDPAAAIDGMKVAKKLGVVAKSRQRDRRPTADELDRLLAHFARWKRGTTPMVDIVQFAIHSTRRQEEITLLRWADLQPGRVMVRDMKHPGEKDGNDQWCDLPAEAEAIARRQPQRGECIFPHSTDAISAAFTRACKLLGIEDLHFHDLRHEGISRLFEQGWTIPQVAVVSGHRSWQSLSRYTHISAARPPSAS